MDVLEHLKSFGTKIMMREPIVHPICMGKKQQRKNERNKETLDDKFHKVFFRPQSFLWLIFYYLSKVFKECLESFGGNIG